MNYLVKVAYDGSKFWGFQRLNEGISVQKVLEDALSKINKSPVVVKGAGRTDRGVHAYGQYISFKLDIDITEDGLMKAMNSIVRPYINVVNVRVVDEGVHARFSVLKKRYIYKMNLGEYDPVKADYVYHPLYKLDIDKMKEVAELYIGIHDFHNFVSGERDDYTAIIHSIDFNIDEDILSIKMEGKSFYRYMVRNLVGMMIEVGRGKEKIDKVREMLDSKDSIEGYTAPACGLYLDDIDY